MSTSVPKPRGADLVNQLRRSIVGVRGVSSGGTGWVALGNGIILTSHEAVGYQIEVFLDLDSGHHATGRVIWVDVTRDLALVLPLEPLGLPPLFIRPDLPRLGESVLALSLTPGQPLRVGGALVSAVDRKVGAIRCFDLDTLLVGSGGPIVDLDGRVVGVGGLDLPRGARRRSTPSRESTNHSPALPIAALQRALAAFDLPTAQFEDRSPTYRCASCGEPYAFENDRCLACGQRLPHAWEPEGGVASPTFSAAERLVRELLARLGAVASSVRVGPRTWKLSVPSSSGSQTTEVTLDVDPAGSLLRGRFPLVRVPASNQEPFYRFLLTLNDQTGGSLRLGVEDDVVQLSFAEPTALVKGEGAARLFEALVLEGERLRKALVDPFDAKPVG